MSLMKHASTTMLFITIIVFHLLSITVVTSTVDEVSLTVYRDGVVHVMMNSEVDEAEPVVVVPLLTKDAYNILVLDESGNVLPYELINSSMTVYSLGASMVTVEYDTDALTSKSAGVWTLSLTTPFQITIHFPENSTILYMSHTPASIEIKGHRISLTLQPGDWEISYEVAPIPIPSPFPTLSPSQTTQQQILLITQYILVTVFAVMATVVIIAVIKRRKKLKELRSEEAEVLKFIRENGGKALEAELREVFPHIPRTSMWRLIKRLEKRGIVSVKKVGMQNVVELK